ncbi:ankyrin repeat domain-containing protein [uncultured Dokdonia sp.]|uniref:ankyrin repeat domain-containing protein n=1 Tax=uncultured Dokdonia sp. TaxID=575653 RepID=UPI00261828B1|nr:ankyrin repeat domain-containing protein [uncultured Dokdonia sp.]
MKSTNLIKVVTTLLLALFVGNTYGQTQDVLGHGFDIRYIDPLDWSSSSKGKTLLQSDPIRTSNTQTFPETHVFVTNSYEFEKEVLEADTINYPYVAYNSKAHYKLYDTSEKTDVLMVYTKKKVGTATALLPIKNNTLDSAFIEDFNRLGRDITPNGFIARYGTHIAQEVAYGGVFLLQNSIAKNDYIYSPYDKEAFKEKVIIDIEQQQLNTKDTDPFINAKKGRPYTIGGDKNQLWFTDWEKTVSKNTQVPIEVRLTPIVEVLRSVPLPEVKDKSTKIKLLDSITTVAMASARNEVSRKQSSTFFKKYSLRFKQEIISFVKKSMGPVKTSGNDYTGDIFFGGFSKDEALLHTKPLIERGGLRLETLITDEVVTLDKNVIVTIKPEDIEYGYMSVWDDTKKLFKSPDRKRLRVAGSEEAKTYYKDALLNNVQKTITLTSIDDHIYEVVYTMKLVRETDLLKNTNTQYNYVIDSELVAAAATGNIERLEELFIRNANVSAQGLIEAVIVNKQPIAILNYILDKGVRATTRDLDIIFEREHFNEDYALTLLERGAIPKNNMIYKAVAYKSAPVVYALFREGAQPRNNDLSFALQLRYYPTVKALMSEDYDVFEADMDQLLLAVENDDNDLAKKFIAMGATADASLLEKAIKTENLELKNTVIPVTEANQESLEVAASINDEKLFEYFIDKEATINTNVAVEIAIDNENVTILDMGLKNGGEPSEALEYAIVKENKPAIEVALKNKAKPEPVFAYAIESEDLQLFEDALLTYGGSYEDALEESVKRDKLAFAQLVLAENNESLNTSEVVPIAVENENLDMVTLLVDNSANPTEGIETAVRVENIPIVQYLISEGAETLSPELITSAVKGENLELSKILIEEGNANANDAIQAAAETANVDITGYLLEKGATADDALKDAMETTNEEIILMLMEKTSSISDNALSIASRKGNLNVVKYLSEKKDFDIQKGLFDAIYYKQDDILEYLLAKGAKVSPELLKDAISVNYISGIKTLINNGVDVNHIYDTNETPLLIYVQEMAAKDTQLITFLLEKGADINATNGNGETAMHIATRRGTAFIELIKILISNEADLTMKTLKGKTALDYASEREIKSLIKKGLKS